MEQIQTRRAATALPGALSVSVAAVLLAQGLVDSLNIGQLLKERYLNYQIVFLPLLAVSLATYVYYKGRGNNISIPYLVSVATFAGYFSGFVAFYMLPLFATDGVQRFLQPPRSGKEWITLAWSSLVILAWLVGGLSGTFVVLLIKKVPGRIFQASAVTGILGLFLLTRRFSLFGHIIHTLQKGSHN